ncbi:MAG TPA: heat-inducible transcription repressor HrcA, partial [Solirubrobacterales bacterium]|nr:heat-inducible transcription repressor HrcA [Solirubrobacterales bacterium]
MLSERRQRILELVAEEYLRSGRPIGSKAISERDDVDWGASTVRNELAALEAEGYLTHPHTSAGRVPTDRGYRFYADAILATTPATTSEAPEEIELTRMRREVEDAMRETTHALSQVTDLL